MSKIYRDLGDRFVLTACWIAGITFLVITIGIFYDVLLGFSTSQHLWYLGIVLVFLLVASAVYGYRKGRKSILKILEQIDPKLITLVKNRENDNDLGDPPHKSGSGFYEYP